MNLYLRKEFPKVLMNFSYSESESFLGKKLLSYKSNLILLGLFLGWADRLPISFI